jgi:hypothetical protein
LEGERRAELSVSGPVGLINIDSNRLVLIIDLSKNLFMRKLLNIGAHGRKHLLSQKAAEGSTGVEPSDLLSGKEVSYD